MKTAESPSELPVTEKQKSRAATTFSQVFIVEDHPTFREGLVQIINTEPDLKVCGQADTAEKAAVAIARIKPDVALIDISLPGKNGLELIKELRSANPRIKLLAVSMHDEALYAARVLRAGGDGYIMKQEDTEEIIEAIRDVLAGHIYVSEGVMKSMPVPAARRSAKAKLQPMNLLTDQELEVMELLGRGQSNPEIARQLRLATAAVAACCEHIRRKLKLKNRDALIRYAVCWLETDVV